MRSFRCFSLLMLISLLLAACAPEPAALNVADAPRQQRPTPTSAQLPTPLPTDAPAVDQCLSCHADKDRLIETAKPVEESAESESKGVG
jgi:hypothetical protein